MNLRFWRRLQLFAAALRWAWLERTARTRRFRAELALAKYENARVQQRSGASDDTEASLEQGITPAIPKRKRAARAPGQKRSAKRG